MPQLNMSNVSDEQVSPMERCFTEACMLGTLDDVKRSIDAFGDINRQLPWPHHYAGRSALDLAMVRSDGLEISIFLLDRGAVPKRMIGCNKRVLHTLVRRGVEFPHDVLWYAASDAAVSGRPERLKVFLDVMTPEQIRWTERSGNTLLHFLVHEGYRRNSRAHETAASVELLLAYGIPYDVQNASGQAPLDMYHPRITRDYIVVENVILKWRLGETDTQRRAAITRAVLTEKTFICDAVINGVILKYIVA